MVTFEKNRDFVGLARLTQQAEAMVSCGASQEESLWEAVRVLERLDKAFVVEAKEKEKTVGAFLLLPFEGYDYDVHVVFDQEHRGLDAVLISKAALKFLFSHTNIRRLVAKCPKENRQVLEYAKAVGLRFLELQEDVVLMEVTKEMVDQIENERT